MTYRQYDERADQYARWAMAHGVGKGDVVALMMPNRPEYLAVWLGIARAGGVIALLNTNLTGTALAHCVNIVKAEARHRRRRAHRQLSHRRAASRRRPALLVPRRRAGRLRAARHAGSTRLPNDADSRRRAAAAHDRGQVPLRLYERHDRPAEGGQHQPLSRPGHHVRLQRARCSMTPGRPHLCLPADVSHVRRRARRRAPR